MSCAVDIHRVTRDVKFEKAVGTNVKAFRKELGWSQKKLADEVNIERKQLSRIEKAEHSATLAIIVAIAKGLGRQPYELLKTDFKVKGTTNWESEKKEKKTR